MTGQERSPNIINQKNLKKVMIVVGGVNNGDKSPSAHPSTNAPGKTLPDSGESLPLPPLSTGLAVD
jgi:hypothetical protein